jgi:hypothetical protein
MAIQELTPRGGRFFVFGSTVVGNGTSACNGLCATGEDFSIAAKNNYWDNAHTFDPSSRGERLGGKPSTLMQCAQRMGGNLNG